jgi:hypothetical protein
LETRIAYGAGGNVLAGGRLERGVAEMTGVGIVALGTMSRSPLYFFQQDAHRHSIVSAPLGSFRRVRRHPNDLLMSV